MARVLIAVPTFENIYPDTFKAIYDIDRCENEVLFEFVRGYDCATARNKIAQKAIDMDTDYVLMVDNDVVIPKDSLSNLLSNDKDVCLGYYAHRGPDNVYSGRSCICRLYNSNGIAYFNYPLESEYTAEELKAMADKGEYAIKIHGGGMGCALIKTDVFRVLKYPWYDWVNYESKGMLSEDLYFCEACRKADIKIYADTRVNCGHMLRHIQYCN